MKNDIQVQNKINAIYKEVGKRFQKLSEVFNSQELGVIFSRAVLNNTYYKIGYKQQMLQKIDEYSKQKPKDVWSEFEKQTIKKIEVLEDIVIQMLVHKMVYLFEYFNDKVADYPKEEKLNQLCLVTENILANVFMMDSEPIKDKVINGIENMIQELIEFEEEAQERCKTLCTYRVIEKITYSNIDFLMETIIFYHQNDRRNYMNQMRKITLDANTDSRGIYDAVLVEIQKIGKHEGIKNRIQNMFRYDDYYFNNIEYKSVADMKKKLSDMYKVNISYAYLEGDRVLHCKMLDKYEPRMGGKLAEINVYFDYETTDDNEQTSCTMYIRDYKVS